VIYKFLVNKLTSTAVKTPIKKGADAALNQGDKKPKESNQMENRAL